MLNSKGDFVLVTICIIQGRSFNTKTYEVVKIGKKRAIIKWMQIGAFLQGSDCHATVNMCLLLAQRQYTKRFWQTSKINTAGF